MIKVILFIAFVCFLFSIGAFKAFVVACILGAIMISPMGQKP